MQATMNPAAEPDRVRRYTAPEILRQIEERIEFNVRFYATQPPQVIDQRIQELREEWSIERYLQINVSAVGLTTALLALTASRKWALLTCGALGFFLFHALRGFDPPIPVLRRMGIRTRREIDREIFALKAVRGDFTNVPVEQAQTADAPAREALKSVNA